MFCVNFVFEIHDVVACLCATGVSAMGRAPPGDRRNGRQHRCSCAVCGSDERERFVDTTHQAKESERGHGNANAFLYVAVNIHFRNSVTKVPARGLAALAGFANKPMHYADSRPHAKNEGSVVYATLHWVSI